MFENIMNFFKKMRRKEQQASNSKDAAKERLHLVLMQDRANVSADFLDLMKQEIIEVIKKYIEVDESAIDVRLTNKENEDGTNGAPALYANIPIVNIKNEARKENKVNTIEEKDITEKQSIEKEDNKYEEEVQQNKEEKNEKVEENSEEDEKQDNSNEEQEENNNSIKEDENKDEIVQ